MIGKGPAVLEPAARLLCSSPAMLTQGDPADALVATVPEWWPEALFWVLIGLLLAASLAAAGVWVLIGRARDLQGEMRRLDLLEELKQRLERLVADRSDLDLRRIEHLLIDLRDGARRVEELLLRLEEAGGRETSRALVPASAPALTERVQNRLLALGYERIELVTAAAELAGLAAQDGEVLVEARREGVLHKGRVRFQGGRIVAVEIQPAYAIFP